MKIDNHALSMFQECPAKYYLRIVRGLVPMQQRAALGFGSAMHEGLAEWYKTGDLAKAMQRMHDTWPSGMPVDDFRTLPKALMMMKNYAQHYPREAFKIVKAGDQPMVEKTFTIDTGMFLDCQIEDCLVPWDPSIVEGKCANCGNALEPIEYGGIIDLLVDFNGQIYIVDHKTTSRFGALYFEQYKPNNQMTGYIWGGKLLSNLNVHGAIINVLVVYKSSPDKFDRSVTTRTDAEIREWLEFVRNTCNQIKTCERTGLWRMHTSQCLGKFGLCEYHPIHKLSETAYREKMIESQYRVDHWDYENRDGDSE